MQFLMAGDVKCCTVLDSSTQQVHWKSGKQLLSTGSDAPAPTSLSFPPHHSQPVPVHGLTNSSFSIYVLSKYCNREILLVYDKTEIERNIASISNKQNIFLKKESQFKFARPKQ